jgi:Nanos RNA binding domain
MSRVNVNRCCKVCKDAGKSAEEYSSHWPKDNTGRVICVTLLNQSCRYCEESGHTVKYCPKLAKDKKNDAKFSHFVARNDRIRVYEEKSFGKKPSAPVAVSRFALLMDDDESDESPLREPRSPKRTQKKAPTNGAFGSTNGAFGSDEFPALSNNIKVVESSQSMPMSWSQMVTTESSSRVAVEMSGLCQLKSESKELSASEKAAAIHRQECFKGLNGKGWADLDSDDDEDEDW